MTEQQQKIILLDMHCQQSFENGKGEFCLTVKGKGLC